jgi:hypothetical protein
VKSFSPERKNTRRDNPKKTSGSPLTFKQPNFRNMEDVDGLDGDSGLPFRIPELWKTSSLSSGLTDALLTLPPILDLDGELPISVKGGSKRSQTNLNDQVPSSHFNSLRFRH